MSPNAGPSTSIADGTDVAPRRLCVGELAAACKLPTPMAYEHLRLMQRCGLLASEKEGRKVYYRVVEPQLKSILKCIENRFGATATTK